MMRIAEKIRTIFISLLSARQQTLIWAKTKAGQEPPTEKAVAHMRPIASRDVTLPPRNAKIK